jgi:hypothetical protein
MDRGTSLPISRCCCATIIVFDETSGSPVWSRGMARRRGRFLCTYIYMRISLPTIFYNVNFHIAFPLPKSKVERRFLSVEYIHQSNTEHEMAEPNTQQLPPPSPAFPLRLQDARLLLQSDYQDIETGYAHTSDGHLHVRIDPS